MQFSGLYLKDYDKPSDQQIESNSLLYSVHKQIWYKYEWWLPMQNSLPWVFLVHCYAFLGLFWKVASVQSDMILLMFKRDTSDSNLLATRCRHVGISLCYVLTDCTMYNHFLFLTVLNSFKIHLYIILFLLLWLYVFFIPCFYYNYECLFHLFLCKTLWITTVYEMCYINKLALPCLGMSSCTATLRNVYLFTNEERFFVSDNW